MCDVEEVKGVESQETLRRYTTAWGVSLLIIPMLSFLFVLQRLENTAQSIFGNIYEIFCPLKNYASVYRGTLGYVIKERANSDAKLLLVDLASANV